MKGPRIFASRLASLIIIGLVIAALTGGALADAESQPADTSRHLLVVPDTPEAMAALARTDARVVASYESFALVEAAGADDERLRAAGADRRDDMRSVRTAAGAIDPRAERRSLAGKEAPERDEALTLVQFAGPPKDAWLDRLRDTGARIVSYQPENAYVVHAAGTEQVERLAALVGGYAPVRAVAVLTAADKLEAGRVATGMYAVQTVAGGAGADARADAAGAGAAVSSAVALGALHTQYLRLSAAEAADLARDPAVVAIEPYAEPGLADERAAQIVAGNLSGFAPSGPGYLDWLIDPARILDRRDLRLRDRRDRRRLRRRARPARPLGLPRARLRRRAAWPTGATTRATPAPTRPRTAAATAPTSPRSPPATTTASPPRRSRTSPTASTTGSGWRRSRSWARPRSSTAPAASPAAGPRRRWPATPTATARASPTTPGARAAWPSGAPTPPARSSTTRWCATRARPTPATRAT